MTTMPSFAVPASTRSLDIQRALFPDDPPKPISVEEMDEAIAQYVREKYAAADTNLLVRLIIRDDPERGA